MYDVIRKQHEYLFDISVCFQVLNAAWDVNIPVASENALPCHDRDGYNKILENAKPMNDPDGRHLSAFTYLRLSPTLMEKHNFSEFERFVKRMHGKQLDTLCSLVIYFRDSSGKFVTFNWFSNAEERAPWISQILNQEMIFSH